MCMILSDFTSPSTSDDLRLITVFSIKILNRLVELSLSHGASNPRHSRQIPHAQTTSLESWSCQGSLSSYYTIILSLKFGKFGSDFLSCYRTTPKDISDKYGDVDL